MEVDLLSEELWEGGNCFLDDTNEEDILNFDGERCGICMDVVIDRGVIDCCHHWFCFGCIDNWATITSLCPLCQNEFQLITCVPVYDTIGGYKTDEDVNQRDDDWFIEGKNNTLSFPSYYIDENAVMCLDEDGCKIRGGSLVAEEDLDFDTSIACDSCDKWYHAFCVGFNPESTSDSSWLCPRCSVDDISQKDVVLATSPSGQHDAGVSGFDGLVRSSFSDRVSVSVVDDGETAIVISLLEGNLRNQESKEFSVDCSDDTKNALSSFIPDIKKSEETVACRNGLEAESPLFEDSVYCVSNSSSAGQLNVRNEYAYADKSISRHSNYRVNDPSLDFDIGSLECSQRSDEKDEGHLTRCMNETSSEENLSHAAETLSDRMEVYSINSLTTGEKESLIRVTGTKRKLKEKRNSDGIREATSEDRASRKKLKADKNNEPVCVKNQIMEPGFDDISDIVKGTDHRSRNHHRDEPFADIASKEREITSGLRLKKILRRTGDETDSSFLLQEIRKKIREAVRNKSSEMSGQLFDPNLLEAFRAALAKSTNDNMKLIPDVKAKRSLLQKGKVRESLTKKIYGSAGKRRRAWTRECEVEFWKHRCTKAPKPEKIQALNSVLGKLRDYSGNVEYKPEKEEEDKVSILSRLYLADTSVFPRKNDIKPVASLMDITNPEFKRENDVPEKASASSSQGRVNTTSVNNCSLELITPPLIGRVANKNSKSLKPGTTFPCMDKTNSPKESFSPSLSGSQISSEKEMVNKSDISKGDKRKWALEVLARKTASSSKNATLEKDSDSAIVKGNHSLLAKLPKEMRPVLAPIRHNKISMPVRQTQLYRLTEHYLKKIDPSSACRTAETELAVANAVAIEKEVADKSNSKLVYVNLCSQELRRRSDVNSVKTEDSNLLSTSKNFSDGAEDDIDISSSDLVVDDALRNAGLVSDSPPISPIPPSEDMKLLEKIEDNELENVLDIYGNFENNLGDDDFIGAGCSKISEMNTEPIIKLPLSDKPSGIWDLCDQKGVKDAGSVNGASVLLESRNNVTSGTSTDTNRLECSPAENSLTNGNEESFLSDCENLTGPVKESLIEKFPECAPSVDQTLTDALPGDNACVEKDPIQSDTLLKQNFEVLIDSNFSSELKESTSQFSKKEDATKKKPNEDIKKQAETHSSVVHKVEAYIKEHVRPLCKIGVITVEQYRWTVQKTTEKVMKYHSKEKNANFLIKEGEKVKKLAEQYVEASQHKVK